MNAVTLIETDARSRVVLPGHSNQRYLMEEFPDGTLRLVPAVVMTESQLEYEINANLRDLLARASASPTVRRTRRERRPE